MCISMACRTCTLQDCINLRFSLPKKKYTNDTFDCSYDQQLRFSRLPLGVHYQWWFGCDEDVMALKTEKKTGNKKPPRFFFKRWWLEKTFTVGSPLKAESCGKLFFWHPAGGPAEMKRILNEEFRWTKFIDGYLYNIYIYNISFQLFHLQKSVQSIECIFVLKLVLLAF